MKRLFAYLSLLPVLLVSASAWAHPGHGAVGLWHHASDLVLGALVALVIVGAVAFVKRRTRR